jgi:hypothetical protein
VSRQAEYLGCESFNGKPQASVLVFVGKTVAYGLPLSDWK